MTKPTLSSSIQTAPAVLSKRIENAFAHNCENEYFTPAELFGLCRCGFPYENLPGEAKRMLDAFLVEYRKRCTGPGDHYNPPLPELPTGGGIVYG